MSDKAPQVDVRDPRDWRGEALRAQAPLPAPTLASKAKAWHCPSWMAPEDVQRYEVCYEALRNLRDAIREAADRLDSANDVTTWQLWVSSIARDADEWTRRLQRVAPKPAEDVGRPENGP